MVVFANFVHSTMIYINVIVTAAQNPRPTPLPDIKEKHNELITSPNTHIMEQNSAHSKVTSNGLDDQGSFCVKIF